MAQQYKKSQIQGTASTGTYTTLYTTPANTEALISTILVCNTGGSPTTIRMGMDDGVGTPDSANGEWLIYDLVIDANDTVTFSLGVTMEALKYIRVSSSDTTVNFTAFVMEVPAIAPANWTQNGSDLYYNSGNVVIGGTTPANSAFVLSVETSDTTAFNADFTPGPLRIANKGADTDQQFAGISFVVGSGGSDGEARIDAIHNGTGTQADLAFSTRAADASVYERMRIDSAGNVGVGNQSPSYPLHVTGNMNVDGTIYVNGSPFAGGGSQWTTNGSNIYYSGGNVGIGTSSPSQPLHLTSTGSFGVALQSTHTNIQNTFTMNVSDPTGTPGITDAGWGISSNEVDRGFFFRQDGNVGIGTTSPDKKLSVNAGNNQTIAEFTGTTASNFIMISGENETQNDNCGIAFNATKDTIPGSANSMAYIQSFVLNSGGALQGDLRFFTNAGDQTYERMRIDSSGNVGIGTTPSYVFDTTKSVDSAYIANISQAGTATNSHVLRLSYSGATLDNNIGVFLGCFDTTASRLFIFSDGDVQTSDAGTLTSDERLKTNIVDATPKLDDLMRVRVRNYEWTPDYHPTKVGEKKIGFIAQELEEVFPSLIGEMDIALDNSIEEVLYVEGDEIPEGKNIGDIKIEAKPHEPVMRKTYKNAFTPILVKSIQELVIMVQELEAKVEALGG